jgi:transposase
MCDLIWLSEAQMRRIEPHFPFVARDAEVDDRWIISGIIFIIRNGLRWRVAPKEYGPHKTIYNRLICLEPARRVQPDLRRAGGERWEARSVDDRCDAPQSAPDGSPLA